MSPGNWRLIPTVRALHDAWWLPTGRVRRISTRTYIIRPRQDRSAVFLFSDPRAAAVEAGEAFHSHQPDTYSASPSRAGEREKIGFMRQLFYWKRNVRFMRHTKNKKSSSDTDRVGEGVREESNNNNESRQPWERDDVLWDGSAARTLHRRPADGEETASVLKATATRRTGSGFEAALTRETTLRCFEDTPGVGWGVRGGLLSSLFKIKL